MSPTIACVVVSPRLTPDPRATSLLTSAQALGWHKVDLLECHDLYFIEADASETDLERLASTLLADPISQHYHWRMPGATVAPGEQVIETALLAGVTDRVANEIVRAAHLIGISGVTRAATGQRYLLHATEPLSQVELDLLARQLFSNPIIQRYAVGEIAPAFPHAVDAENRVETIPLRGLTNEQLLSLSADRRAALDLDEMRSIQEYFTREGRDPTDVEFEMLAQTWSEHCIHKTFRAKIDLESPQSEPGPRSRIDGLLRSYIRAATDKIGAPWVRSAFVDNAGIIDFDDEYEVSFKVETHNHPSAIEPFGGANTGIGGVIRDVLGVSAKPIAATDVLCFGPQEMDLEELPQGVLHPRRIRAGVVAGIEDYGNKIGIPTVNGAIIYDPGYVANPLVFCGCVGIAPKGKHPRAPQPGDRVIVLGGRTGRDGLRGATFSSMTMDAQTGDVAGASVQIGDPITEKGLIEVIVRARDQGLYHAITDCGAGGLSSAVGEMARGLGAEVDISRVRLKYSGLTPWEIWLSEAQERMVLAIPAASVGAVQSLCDDYDVELTDIGAFEASGRIRVRYGERRVLDLETEFLHEGIPQRHLHATLSGERPALKPAANLDPESHLLTLLSSPNIASKAEVIRVYDHEVQGGTVVKPLTGVMNDGPSDGCVLKPLGTHGTRGVALACGVNPTLGMQDAYAMAVSVIDEAIRNLVALGADPTRIALLDNFCWGNPLEPATLGTLVEAARGCYDAALAYAAPFISGKDSLNNEYMGADGLRHSIPPTLLISAIGIVEDIDRVVTMDLKAAGDKIYLLGAIEAVANLPAGAPARYRALHLAIRAGLVRACHDLSDGGLAAAIAEMCIGGRLGAKLQLDTGRMDELFGEANGRLLVEVHSEQIPAFEKIFHGDSEVRQIGTVTGDGLLEIRIGPDTAVALPVDQLVRAWNGGSQG